MPRMMTGHAGWWGMSVCLFVSAGVLWDHLGLGKGWAALDESEMSNHLATSEQSRMQRLGLVGNSIRSIWS